MFIETMDGTLINLDHVEQIERLPRAKKEDRRLGLLRDREGRVMGKIDLGWNDMERLTESAPVILPSWPNTKGVLLTYWEGKVDDEECDIIGWQINPVKWEIADAVPILLEKPASNQKLFLRLPDGSLLEQESRTFDTLDQAKDDFLTRQQAAEATP